ncbi:MAG: DUF1697 domain-containing protein [Pseudomonadota bacterium]
MRKIALLRGVNVGGRNKLPMKAFAAALEGLGCENVKTYIQSGNAIFDGEASAADIAGAVKKAAGFTPHVFVISAAALGKAARANPFSKEAAASGKSVHLFLLEAPPAAEAAEALGKLKHPREDFAIGGKTLYLYTPEGVAGSKIAERIDRVLGTTTTARNWNTIEALLALAENK